MGCQIADACTRTSAPSLTSLVSLTTLIWGMTGSLELLGELTEGLSVRAVEPWTCSWCTTPSLNRLFRLPVPRRLRLLMPPYYDVLYVFLLFAQLKAQRLLRVPQ